MKKQHIVTTQDIQNDHNRKFIINFGTQELPEFIPNSHRFESNNISHSDILKIQKIHPKLMEEGLVFLINQKDMPEAKLAIKIQKKFIHHYVNSVLFPSLSTLSDNPHGIGKKAAPELVRISSKTKNTPFLLRYPLAEKLQDQHCCVPVLILLPGPSLVKIGPFLKELSRHCAIIAISRTLQFCLQHDVYPDFVVQLDTFLAQKHFYEKIDKKLPTTLISLSISPIISFASKFRGLFFMDSFDTSILQNNWRLRESPLSTLLACMGLSEVLYAPQAILAGSDLCFDHHQNRYLNKTFEESISPAPAYIQTNNNTLLLANRKGLGVTTSIGYLATAVEAEHFARDIEASVGTNFYTIDDNGILCPEHFPTMPVEEILQLPILNRQALHASVDRALEQSENIKLPRFKIDCDKTLQALDQNMLFLEACRIQGCPEETLAQNPIRLFADQERDYHLPDDPKAKLDFSVKILRQWREAVCQARNITLAHMLAKHDGAIDLLCLPEETITLPLKLKRLFRGFRWTVRPVVSLATPHAERSQQDLMSSSLNKSLLEVKVAFVSPDARDRFDYLFDVYPGENLVYLQSYMLE